MTDTWFSFLKEFIVSSNTGYQITFLLEKQIISQPREPVLVLVIQISSKLNCSYINFVLFCRKPLNLATFITLHTKNINQHKALTPYLCHMVINIVQCHTRFLCHQFRKGPSWLQSSEHPQPSTYRFLNNHLLNVDLTSNPLVLNKEEKTIVNLRVNGLEMNCLAMICKPV